MSFTPSPLFAHVTVTHSGTPYSLDSSLVECDPVLAADGRAGMCELDIRNDSGAYNNLFVYGDTITISLYKTGLAAQNIFNGFLQRVRPKKEFGGSGNKHILLTAVDGSGYLQNRLANVAYQTFQATGQGYTIDYLVKDLVTNKNNLLSVQAGYTTQGLPITCSNVPSIPIYIRNITFQQQSVFDCLRQLAQYSFANFYVDANLDLHFFQVASVTSPNVLNDSVICEFDVEDDGTNITNLLAVNGGNVAVIDDSQQTYSGGSVSTYNASVGSVPYLAVQFTPGNFDLSVLSLYLSKTQSNPAVPVNSLQGEILTDNAGVPGSTVVATFTLTSNDVPSTPAWTPISVSATLQPGTKYWIVLYMSGQDANNHYNWYYAAATDSKHPTVVWNGTSWVSQSYAFAFEELVSEGILKVAYDPTSASTYNGQFCEASVTDLGLTTQQAAGQYAIALLGIGQSNWGQAKKKRFFRITAIPPDIPINPGEQVHIINSDNGVDQYATCLQAAYQIRGLKCLSASYQLQAFQY